MEDKRQLPQHQNKQLRLHVIDNILFTAFFRFLNNRFKEVFEGTKRFHWILRTKRKNVRLFYLGKLQVCQSSREYLNNEILLYKLIFTTTTNEQMLRLGFNPQDLDPDWDCIDHIRKRKRNFRNSKQFFEIDVIRQLWFCQNGFYYSTEMQEFIRTYLHDNPCYYIQHFQKYCEVEWLNLDALRKKNMQSQITTPN